MLVALGVAVAAMPDHAAGQSLGELAVTPTRIVLEGRARSARVILLNRGSATNTYRIKFVEGRMANNGAISSVESLGPDEKSAARLLRYAPRQVVLPPGGSQAVRVLLRKPRNLPEGEYRSHLYFQAVPKASAGRNIESRRSERGIRVQLTVIPGLMIPVIVRHGNLDVQANMTQLRLDRTPTKRTKAPRVILRLNRRGNRSLYGDVTVTYRDARSGRDYVLARANRLAVYTPNPFRNVTLPLRLPRGLRLARGRIHVSYREPAVDGGRTLAENQIEIR